MSRKSATAIEISSPIRNCSWGFKCEKVWDGLIATDNESVRFCDACDKNVFLCKTKLELADAVLLNRCAAFSPRLLDVSYRLSAKEAFPETGLDPFYNVGIHAPPDLPEGY